MARNAAAADLDTADWRVVDASSNGYGTRGRGRTGGYRSDTEHGGDQAPSESSHHGLVDRLRLNRLGVRLVAGVLLVTLPIVIVMAMLLTTRSSSSLTDASHAKSASLARAVALRLEDWLQRAGPQHDRHRQPGRRLDRLA